MKALPDVEEILCSTQKSILQNVDPVVVADACEDMELTNLKYQVLHPKLQLIHQRTMQTLQTQTCENNNSIIGAFPNIGDALKEEELSSLLTDEELGKV